MNDEINSEIIEAMSRVIRIMKHNISFQSRRLHITMLQIEALWCIKKKEHAHMGDIAENFSITMPTASSLVDKLITTRLAKRASDKKDRRIVRISLTREGERLLKEVSKQRKNKINKLLSYLSDVDKKELLRILKKIVEKSKKYEK